MSAAKNVTAGKGIKIKVNGTEVKTKQTVLLAALKEVGIEVPTLCYHPDLPALSTCRLCLVEVNGQVKTSCNQQVFAGMEIRTNTARVLRERKTNLELILANHPFECEDCASNGRCELQKLAEQFGISDFKYAGKKRSAERDESSTAIQFDPKKCILCERCTNVCDRQKTSILALKNRGWETIVAPVGGAKMSDTPCVYCGRCTLHCPTGAFFEKDEIDEVIAEINNPNKKVVVQIAPSIRVTLGEYFGMKPGEIATKKISTALRMCGFDAVLDTSLGADMTIVEEAHELVERIKTGKALPQFTSCCPAWVYYVEYYRPELTQNLSTTKSPHIMLGAAVKTYYAEKTKTDPKDIVVVSIMPCTAKKAESARVEHKTNGMRTVDYVLTTREAARMLKLLGINLAKVKDGNFDSPLETTTGAGEIFASTGGVMEAALRTANFYITGKELTKSKLDFKEVRGLEGVKKACVKIGGKKLSVAVAHGLENAEKAIAEMKKNPGCFDFIEIMCCPGGCIGGGGQSVPHSMEKVRARMKGIYLADKNAKLRVSHENPSVKALYSEFLEKPGSKKAHELLHTHYVKRDKYAP
ncbi:MAG: [FeFe] hydrogenase, group A [Candidatus Diapherotrites archaeon]|nr:[FeFe] hydrogenase, group A [Candidatus Micrarchaeota archaeon]